MIGKYNQKFIWLKQLKTTDTTYNEKKESWQPYAELWGYVEQTDGQEVTQNTALTSETYGTIHLNLWADVRTVDRLQDKRFGDVWEIQGIARSFKPQELIITAIKRRVPSGNPYT